MLVLFRIVFSLLLLSVFNLSAQQCRGVNDSPPVRALYFSPETDNHSFWGMQREYMKAVARNLNIELTLVEIKPDQENSFAFIDLIHSKLREGIKPDIILGIFYLNGEMEFLEYVESEKIPFFSVNVSLPALNAKKVGKPRENFPHWIGHMAPNDENAGYQLALDLIDQQSSPPVMMSLSGDAESSVAYNRATGANRVSKEKGVHVLPLINTNWSNQQGYSATKQVYRHFPNVNIIWTAGPGLARGALEFLRDSSLDKKSIQIGTFDWSVDVLNLLIKKEIDISFGGHFREAGWALILAYDYFSGIDFKTDIGLSIETQLQQATHHNARSLLTNVQQNWLKTDFRKFSKCLNSSLKTYNFN